jgi:ABC-type antimicrobial peptide transport system permease subunit
MMIKSYLKITFRNITKHKGYSFINIIGLAFGMTVCILIFLWVRDELSFDRFHKNANEIYRVVVDEIHQDGNIQRVAVTPWPLGAALLKDYPEVINFTRYFRVRQRLITYKPGNKSFYENSVYLADPPFLEMFSFPLVKGDPATALAKGNTVVITGEIAEKYFGKEDPMGKTLTINNIQDYTVTGVIKNVPHNSHLQFDFILPFEQTLKNYRYRGSWGSKSFHTFVLLQKGVSVKALGEKIYEYLIRLFPYFKSKLKLQSLTDMHLRSDYGFDLYGASKDTTVYLYIFSLIAILILLIACINFVNLTLARASTRAKEVGLRKVVGARRKDLIKQFYGESILFTIAALIFAIALVYLLLPLFNNLAGKELTIDTFTNIGSALGLLLIAIVTGITAGIYPAFILSSFQPANVIMGELTVRSGKPRGALFRKVLVVFQFTLSIALIIVTLLVNQQLSYMQNIELGYEKDNIIYFTQRGNIRGKYNTFKEELQKMSDVVSVTTSSDGLAYTVHSTSDIDWEGKTPEALLWINHFTVDQDYLKTFKMEIAEGRGFSKDFTTDAAGNAYIVNQAAIKAMNMKNPIGKSFTFWGKKGTIIGVVKDFHYKSLHTEIEPLVLRIEPNRDRYIFVKVRSENTASTLDYIKKAYQKFNPQYPFEYHFLDDELNTNYDSDRRTLNIFRYSTVIAIFISCLGLFGLAAFTAQLRTREIGIRKVVGASVSNIILMLSKEFLLLVGTANILAWPLAYFAMNKWMQGFAYRTTIGLGTFIFSAILAMFIAICTVLYQSIKAATTNPVETIKYE